MFVSSYYYPGSVSPGKHLDLATTSFDLLIKNETPKNPRFFAVKGRYFLQNRFLANLNEIIATVAIVNFSTLLYITLSHKSRPENVQYVFFFFFCVFINTIQTKFSKHLQRIQLNVLFYTSSVFKNLHHWPIVFLFGKNPNSVRSPVSPCFRICEKFVRVFRFQNIALYSTLMIVPVKLFETLKKQL